MKVLSFAEFTALPAGTIFSIYEPCIVRGLYRKGETCFADDGRAIDFFMESMIADHQCGDVNGGFGIGGSEHWGEFDDAVTYIIYEEGDRLKLKEMLGFA